MEWFQIAHCLWLHNILYLRFSYYWDTLSQMYVYIRDPKLRIHILVTCASDEGDIQIAVEITAGQIKSLFYPLTRFNHVAATSLWQLCDTSLLLYHKSSSFSMFSAFVVVSNNSSVPQTLSFCRSVYLSLGLLSNPTDLHPPHLLMAAVPGGGECKLKNNQSVFILILLLVRSGDPTVVVTRNQFVSCDWQSKIGNSSESLSTCPPVRLCCRVRIYIWIYVWGDGDDRHHSPESD